MHLSIHHKAADRPELSESGRLSLLSEQPETDLVHQQSVFHCEEGVREEKGNWLGDGEVRNRFAQANTEDTVV